MKAAKTKRTGLTEEERREKIRIGLMKKKECEAKALTVVEKLLDPVDSEWFREASFFLNPSYYEDVVHERSCIYVCGYPLCDKKVDSTGTKKYAISTKDNKVYDITERKKFCSNLCFKRSNFYSGQLLSSPLWLRDENDKKKRVLFYEEVDHTGKSSGKGEEVKFFKTKDVEKSKEEEKEEMEPPNEEEPDDDLIKRMEALKVAPETKEVMKKKPRVKEEKFNLEKVKNSLVKWFTIDTFRVVKGDDYVRQVLLEKNCSVENVIAAVGDENLQGTFEFRSRYVELCRRLDLRELEDQNVDKAELEDASSGSSGRCRGDSTYEKIREEAELNQMKINSFLQGKTEFDQDIISKKKSNSQIPDIQESNVSSEVEPRIPLVDRVAQNSLRRKIFNDWMDRTLPDLLQLMGILRNDINHSLQKIIHSFSLDAESIVLKPDEWTLISVLILRMISMMDEVVLKRLQNPSSKKYLNMILFSYGAQEDFIDVTIELCHSDVDGLLKKMKNSCGGVVIVGPKPTFVQDFSETDSVINPQ